MSDRIWRIVDHHFDNIMNAIKTYNMAGTRFDVRYVYEPKLDFDKHLKKGADILVLAAESFENDESIQKIKEIRQKNIDLKILLHWEDMVESGVRQYLNSDHKISESLQELLNSFFEFYVKPEVVDGLSDFNVSFLPKSFVKINEGIVSELIGKYYCSERSKKLFVLCAPSAFGKSSLIEKLELSGAKALPKITTRALRPGEKNNAVSISFKNFHELDHRGEILASHFFDENRNFYGLLRSDFDNFDENRHEAYIFDVVDTLSALKLRAQFPDKVKLVGIFPGLDFAGYGLEVRLANLSNPKNFILTSNEQFDRIKKNKIAVLDAYGRLQNSIKKAREYSNFLPEFDYVLDGDTMEQNYYQLLQIISEDKR